MARNALEQAMTAVSMDGHGGLREAMRIAIVGPLPPPSAGMANQCEQLVALLERDGAHVEMVQTNAPYRPAWIGRVRGVRALFRLVPYIAALWRAAGRADAVHLFANSGWAWHLVAAPAVWVAKARGAPIIVNYRGGNAGPFLAGAPKWVAASLRSAQAVVVPSQFLKEIFARHAIDAQIVPNIVDFSRFHASDVVAARAPCVLVARALEPIYDVDSAMRAFELLRAQFGDARMVIAGSGPEREPLERLAAQLGVGEAVRFTGRVDNAAMPSLYRDADLALNPSTVDNMPISLLEAFASGVPVVSTNVGGVPHLARDEVTALLVPPGDAAAMAQAMMRLLRDRPLYLRVRAAALEDVQRYGWPSVREQWLACYRRCASGAFREAAR